MDRWGRRWTLCFSMILGGAACLATLSFQNGKKTTFSTFSSTTLPFSRRLRRNSRALLRRQVWHLFRFCGTKNLQI